MNDRISDLARARMLRHDRRLGGAGVTADIIRFIPRPTPGPGPTDFPTIAFRSASPAEECADTAPCECLPSDHGGPV
jgi:hypothetical protein